MSQPQRQYESATLFNVRITDMRHLWEPAREFKGKVQDKPSWFTAFITPKTCPQWHLEPALAGVVAAFSKIMATRQISGFPVSDGDLPNAEGKSSEWAKGHWIVSASTSQQPNIEIVMPGGQVQKLPGKVMGVKSGDFVMAGVTAVVKQNDPRAVKLYLNAVLFTAPGPEIVFANNVSGAELVAQAQAQGMQVQGYTPSGGFGGGGFGASQQGGAPFGQGGFGAPGQGQGGFAAPNAGQNPAFSNGNGFGAPAAGPFGGPAPMTGGPAFGGPAPGQNGTAQPGFGGAASPSNGFGAAPQGGQFGGGGFAAPGGFGAPQGGFPGR
jgi:hypothetical protein